MRIGKLVLSVLAILIFALTATAVAKVDQTGWPTVGTQEPHFHKSYATNGEQITGTETDDELLGYHGADKILGLGGTDVLFGDWSPNNPANQADYLDGGAGNDFLYGSHGKGQVLIGGDGNDKIHARYGGGTISCGPGTDKVWQARKRRKNWKIASDCEKITYALDKKQNTPR